MRPGFTEASSCLALALALALAAGPALAAPQVGSNTKSEPSTGTEGASDAEKKQSGFLGDLSSSNEPIVVRSDQLEFDYQKDRIIYRGTVNAKQGELSIDCKELIVNLDRVEKTDNLQLREVVAVGDVVITQGERRATGGRAIFDQQTRQITLLENPVLHDGPNEVTGERLIVYLDQGRSVVESSPSKRVSAILYPGKEGEGINLAGEPKNPEGAKP